MSGSLETITTFLDLIEMIMLAVVIAAAEMQKEKEKTPRGQ
jgi:hypothetical protein